MSLTLRLAVQSAVAERLDDLIRVAQRLRAAVVAESPAAPLPTFPLARLAVDVDAMVGRLEGHAEQLAGGPTR